jgi:hypothetical protein
MPDQDTHRAQSEAIDHLAGHIAMLYAWGLIPLDGDIMTNLFSSATPMELRSRVMEFCGQVLAKTTEPSPDFVARARELWEWRETELTAGTTGPQELRSIGWWMSSAIIPSDWALARLQNFLRAGGAPEPDHLVAKRLVELSPEHLARTVQCVSLLIEAPTDRWFIEGSRTEITAVLTAGVNSPDEATQQEAVDTVNRLVARGRTSFASILS